MLTPPSSDITLLLGTEESPKMKVIYRGVTIEVPDDLATKCRALLYWNPLFPQLILGDVVLGLIERGLLVLYTPYSKGEE